MKIETYPRRDAKAVKNETVAEAKGPDCKSAIFASSSISNAELSGLSNEVPNVPKTLLEVHKF